MCEPAEHEHHDERTRRLRLTFLDHFCWWVSGWIFSRELKVHQLACGI